MEQSVSGSIAERFWGTRRQVVAEHGRLHGAHAMKAEIFARGPISCGIDATKKLDKYEGGIFAEHKPLATINHIVSVIGWGVEDDVEYWCALNPKRSICSTLQVAVLLASLQRKSPSPAACCAPRYHPALTEQECADDFKASL